MLGSMEIDSCGILRALNKKKKAQCVSMAEVDPVIYSVSAGVEPDYSKAAANVPVRGIGELHQRSTLRGDW